MPPKQLSASAPTSPTSPAANAPRRRLHRDLAIAPAGEALLLLIAGTFGLLVHQPLLFASLGPTAFELVETPQRRSARPWNILVGHSLGIGCGFLALAVTHAAKSPGFSDHLPVEPARLLAAALAVLLTVLGTLLLRAMQPAALSTTLLVSLGAMQEPRDAAILFAGVLLVLLFGEPIRRWRLRSSPSYTESDFLHLPPAPARLDPASRAGTGSRPDPASRAGEPGTHTEDPFTLAP